MKVLIVDDEQHIIDAVQLLVLWESFGITDVLTACSVPEACDLLEAEQPEIAIVDVVIGDGLGIDLLKHIKEQNMPTKAIVISGYDDYQYIRAMFVLDAVDYLLKPIVPEELEAAVAKTVQMVSGASMKSKTPFHVDRQLRHLFPDHHHALLRKLFQRELREISYQELSRINSYIRESRMCCVLYCYGLFLPIYSREYVIELSNFLNHLQNQLETANFGSVFQKNDPTPDVVILVYREIDQAVELIRVACADFNRRNGNHIYLGCSGECEFPQEIDAAWNRAEIAFDHIGLDTHDLICVYSPEMTRAAKKVNLDMENKVFSALAAMDTAQYQAYMDHWIENLVKDLPHTRGGIRCLWEMIADFRKRLYGYFSVAPEARPALPALASPDWNAAVAAMKEEAIRSGLLLAQERSRQGSNTLWAKQLAQHLEANYAQKFRQQEYADMLHVNKDYMSRKFKEIYGMSMVAYLNEIRIRKSKELLRNTDLRIQEIADQVGYFDSKYFAQQFKKIAGCSPNEYRNKKN